MVISKCEIFRGILVTIQLFYRLTVAIRFILNKLTVEMCNPLKSNLYTYLLVKSVTSNFLKTKSAKTCNFQAKTKRLIPVEKKRKNRRNRQIAKGSICISTPYSWMLA